MTSDVTDKRELQIRDAMGVPFWHSYRLALTKADEAAFSKDLLLLMLKQYGSVRWIPSSIACKNFKGNAGQTRQLPKAMGFESNEEYNEIMFLKGNHPYGKRTERHGQTL